MKATEQPLHTPNVPYFGDLYIAVFNTTAADRSAALASVAKRYGLRARKSVAAVIKKHKGVMGIFKELPSPALQWFAIKAGERADRRASKRKRNPLTATGERE